MSKVLLVDNHGFTLSTLATALTGTGHEVMACDSARSALRAVGDFEPEVAVLDFDLGTGPTGIDLALRLRELYTRVGVTLLTSYRDPRLHSAGLPALPVGSIYLCKADLSDFAILSHAIELVRHAPLARRDSLFTPRGASAELTDTQVEVLIAIASGSSTAQIALARGVSQSAVEKMIARLAERLGVERDSDRNLRVQLTQVFQQLRELDGA